MTSNTPSKSSSGPKRIKLEPTPNPLPPQYADLLARLKLWRDEAAKREWGDYFLLGGLGIIGDEQIDRIVGLAHRGVLPDLKALQTQLDWCYHHEYGPEVLAIVHEVYPNNLPNRIDIPAAVSPSTNDSSPLPIGEGSSLPPLSPGSGSAASPAKKTRKTHTCRACGRTGHIGEYSEYRYNLYSND